MTGTISAEEFRTFFHKYAGKDNGSNITDNDLNDIMREIDADGQGTISKDGECTCMLRSVSI